MTGIGIIDVITLLLGLANFSVRPNANPPTPDQSLHYAMADADVVAHLDAASLIPGNYKTLTMLPDQPDIKASPELAKLVREAVTEVDGARGLARTVTGIDFATDVTDATIFAQIVPHGEPVFVATIHGKLSPSILAKVAKVTNGHVTTVGTSTMVELGVDSPALGLTKDGVMLAGTPRLVRERLAEDWKAPPHGPGTNLGYAADVLAGKPVVAIVLTLSPAVRKQIIASVEPSFFTDVIDRHKLASFAVFHDGIGWTWIDSTKAGLESMAMVSDGVIDLLRAAQVAPRGVAKIVLGALDSYKALDKRIEELAKHKADILKLVDTFTGDGLFKVQTTKDIAGLRLTVRATGRSLSEVLPLGFAGPLALVGWLMGGRAVHTTAPTTIAIPPQQGQPVTPQLPHRKAN